MNQSLSVLTQLDDSRLTRIVQKIAPGSKILGTWALKGGISAEVTAFEIEQPDGVSKKMILRRPGAGTLKQNPRATQDEFNVLRMTQALGLSAPKPYYLDDSTEILPFPYVVIEYIEGKMELAPARRAEFAAAMAVELVEIHSADYSHLDNAWLPKHANGFADELSRRAPQPYASFQEERIRRTLEGVSPLYQYNKAALLHGDFWAGNVLWKDDKLVAVIDWEDAKLGDPLMDFAVSRLEMLWTFGREAESIFTAQYVSRMSLNYTNLPYWDLYAALRLTRMAAPDLDEWVGFFHPYDRDDITQDTFRADYHFFVERAFDALSDVPVKCAMEPFLRWQNSRRKRTHVLNNLVKR